MEVMDLKAKQMCERYCRKIINREFNEYDIYNFYIFIRGYLGSMKGEYGWIQEWSDLIAHRKRDRGKVFQNISNAKHNNYEVIEGSKMIKDYVGMPEGTLEGEFYELLKELGYEASEKILKEIVLCTLSIANFAQYVIDEANGIIGEIRLWQTNNGVGLVSCADIRNGDEVYVWLTGLTGDFLNTDFFMGYLKKPVEVIRQNGELVIMYEGKVL